VSCQFFSQGGYSVCHQGALLDAFRMNSRSVVGRNPSVVIPLLANQDLICSTEVGYSRDRIDISGSARRVSEFVSEFVHFPEKFEQLNDWIFQ